MCGGTATVLLIVNNDHLLQDLQWMLGFEEHEVLVAENVARSSDIIMSQADNPPTVIVILYSTIRKDYDAFMKLYMEANLESTPFILLPYSIDRNKDLGIKNVITLTSPFSAEEFFNTLESVIPRC